MKNKESFWEIKGAFPLQKQLVIRHKIEGVINPLFCAECLPLFIRAADHGCFIWVSGKGSNITAVFLSQTSLKSSLNKKDEELMKQIKINKKGFTLIEILIVVLIIGILAAIAVPQYKLAVDKANFKKYQAMVHSLSSAYDEYYLAHGRGTQNFSDLSISLPQDFTSSFTNLYSNCYSNLQMFCCISQPRTDNSGKIHCGKSDLSVVYSEIYLGHNYAEVNKNTNKHCLALYNNQKANKFCSKLGRTDGSIPTIATPQGMKRYDRYFLN